MRRPRVWQIIIAMLIGAAANLAIVWLVPLHLVAMPLQDRLPDEKAPTATLRWPVPVPPSWEPSPSFRSVWRSWLHDTVSYGNSAFVAHVVDPASPKGSHGLTAERYGWPWRSMQHIVFHEGTVGGPTMGWYEGGLDARLVARWVPWVSPTPVVYDIAVKPMWAGTLFNSFTFAAVILVVLVGIDIVRVVIRRHRGLCPACAYDMRGLAVCPECGGVGSTAAH